MPSKDAIAKELARAHFAIEPEIERIFRLLGSNEADPQEPLKLLEVNPNTVPEGIVPVEFGPDAEAGIPYSSDVVEITPTEFEQIQGGELQLPNGWKLDEEYSRPAKEESKAG